MLRHTSQGCGRTTANSIFGWRTRIRTSVFVGVACSLLSCFGERELHASQPPQQQHRSIPQDPSGTPNSSAINSSRVALTAGQTHRFEATDPNQDSAVQTAPKGAGAPTEFGADASSLQDTVSASSVGTDVSPSVAEVTYQNGQLTIDAKNTTLANVLALVATKTGAAIDVPPGAGLERIVEHAGPGQPKDVLTQLLNGSHFNFIIVNSSQHPYMLEKVLLSISRNETETGNGASATPTAPASHGEAITADAVPSSPVSPTKVNSAVAPAGESIPPEVLEQMMKDKAREIRETVQQQ